MLYLSIYSQSQPADSSQWILWHRYQSWNLWNHDLSGDSTAYFRILLLLPLAHPSLTVLEVIEGFLDHQHSWWICLSQGEHSFGGGGFPRTSLAPGRFAPALSSFRPAFHNPYYFAGKLTILLSALNRIDFRIERFHFLTPRFAGRGGPILLPSSCLPPLTPPTRPVSEQTCAANLPPLPTALIAPWPASPFVLWTC